VQLGAIRKLVTEAADHGLVPADLAASVLRVQGAKRRGARAGNWLTLEQARDLLAVPDANTLKGKRNRAMLALLLGCALRRGELAQLCVEQIQQREARWAIVDLVGKGRRVRTVPVPAWVKQAVDLWTAAAGIVRGRIFRGVQKADRVWGEGLTPEAVWGVVESAARQIGIEKLAPHDLRRTCAKLCRRAGGDLQQIQFLLGHASIQTTERYLGTGQELATAVNDRLEIL
jgi:integrase